MNQIEPRIAKQVCKYCGKLISGYRQKRFCRYACSYAYRQEEYRKGRQLYLSSLKRTLLCKQCRQKITAPNKRVFCSSACYIKNQRNSTKAYLQEARTKNPRPLTFCHGCYPHFTVVKANEYYCLECNKLVTNHRMSVCDCPKHNTTGNPPGEPPDIRYQNMLAKGEAPDVRTPSK